MVAPANQITGIVGETVAEVPGAGPSISVNEDGVAHIAGSSMKVRHIVMEARRLKLSVNQIHEAHENLSVEQIRCALKYYRANRTMIDAEIAAEDDYVAEARKIAGNQASRAELQERLRKLRSS